MDGETFWIRFVVAALAAWRLTHLLSQEDGPADLIVRLRSLLGDGFAGKLMDCFYCLSVWIAAPLAFFVADRWLERALVWLAISGAACILEKATGRSSSASVGHCSEEGVDDVLLWSKENGFVAGRSAASAEGSDGRAGRPVA